MIYTKMTNDAIKLMFDKHKNQVDKQGIPYVFHPWHVAESMLDEKRTTVALLHDIIEDTDMTLDNLIKMGFPNDVVEAINIMTHKDGEDYSSYIERIATNDIAIDVKIADLTHNMDITRFADVSVDKNSLPKYQIYEKSLEYLKNIKYAKGQNDDVLDKHR